MNVGTATDSKGHEISTFVVRIWVEDCAAIGSWRGHVTHVLSTERCHFDDLAAMNDFLMHHVRRMEAPANTE